MSLVCHASLCSATLFFLPEMMMKLRVAKQAKEVCTIFCDAEEALVIMMVAAALKMILIILSASLQVA